MRDEFIDIESIITVAAEGRLNYDAINHFCAFHGLKFGNVCNTMALEIAKRFNDSIMSYEDADRVANALGGVMTEHLTREPGARLPEPGWTIFLAFDAGEFDRGDGSDPVEHFTKPQIREILRQEDNGDITHTF